MRPDSSIWSFYLQSFSSYCLSLIYTPLLMHTAVWGSFLSYVKMFYCWNFILIPRSIRRYLKLWYNFSLSTRIISATSLPSFLWWNMKSYIASLMEACINLPLPFLIRSLHNDGLSTFHEIEVRFAYILPYSYLIFVGFRWVFLL